MKNSWTIALAAAILAGCATSTPRDLPTATASLEPTAGNNTRGIVIFTEHDNTMRVSGEVSGLQPNSQHGFHVHEKGDCSAPDAMSAGGHFNPTGKAHGHLSPDGRHVGDMPNLRADREGRASFSFDLSGMTLRSGETSVLGKAVIVHAKPDDYRTQPTGGAGDRLACGVIKQN